MNAAMKFSIRENGYYCCDVNRISTSSVVVIDAFLLLFQIVELIN